MIIQAAYKVEKCDRQTDDMDGPIRHSQHSLDREENNKIIIIKFRPPIIGRK
jgi:hypothetical protein